jgi:LCP family protein required for cell wall assembly
MVLEFPRDLWVEIPGISEHYNITHGKLNQAYLYGNKGMGYYTGAGEGPGLLARTLDLNFGARPDHYVAANMQTFVKLVNAVGGIDVKLDLGVDARKPDQPNRLDLYFAKGRHHLNGEQALMLARLRPNNVFGRADQQNRVLCALRASLLNPANLPKLPKIIDAFDGAIQTDLSPQQISQLACLATTKLDAQDITFVSFPTDLLKGARTYDIGMDKELFIWDADFDILRTYVSAFNTGSWPILPPVPVTAGQPNGITPEPSFSCP